MRKLMVLLTLATLLLVCPNAVRATMTFYTDRTTFDLAAPGLPMEDFEKAQVDPYGIKSMPNPLDKFTNNTIFQPGDILDGLRVGTPDNNTDSALAIPGAGFNSIVPSKSVYGNFFGTGLDATFYNNNVYMVGLDLLSYSSDSGRTVSIFGSTGLLGTDTLNVTTSGTFFGVVSTDVITRIDVAGVSGLTIGFDNIAFGSSAAVPEPATMLLLGSGLLGLAGYGRRKFFKK